MNDSLTNKINKLINEIKNIFQKYNNLSIDDISKIIQYKKNPKNQKLDFFFKILEFNKYEKNDIFENEEISFRTIVLDKNESFTESVCLSSITIEEMELNKKWENTNFYKSIYNKKIFFIVFKEYKNNLYLNDAFVFEINNVDLLNAKNIYLDTKIKFNNGNIRKFNKLKNKWDYNFIKMSDANIFHIRPRAKNSEDCYTTQFGEKVTKQAFWLNKSSILDRYIKFKNDIKSNSLYDEELETKEENVLSSIYYAFKDNENNIWKDIPFSYFDISNRLRNCLFSSNIKYISEINKMKWDDVINIRNIGKKTINELEELINKTIKIVDEEKYLKLNIMEVVEKPILSNKNNADLSIVFVLLGKEIDINTIFLRGIKDIIINDIEIKNINFSVRTHNALSSKKIDTFKKLMFIKNIDFNNIENLGAKSKQEIFDKINELLFIYENKLNKTIEIYLDKFIKNTMSNVIYNIQLFKNILSNYLDYDIIKNLDNFNINDLLKNNSDWNKYIQDFIIFTINNSYNKSLTFQEIKHEFLDKNFTIENLEKILNVMIANDLLINKSNNYFIKNKLVLDYIEEKYTNDEIKNILRLRLQGISVSDISKITNINRVNISRIIDNFFENANNCWEDNFKKIFEKYNFDFESFNHILELPLESFNYLLGKYNIGKNEIWKISNDCSWQNFVIENSIKYKNLIGITIENGDFVFKKRGNIINYLLNRFPKEEDINYYDFFEVYKNFLKEHKIDNNSDLYSQRVLENKISSMRNILWKYGKNFRFYNIDNLNIDEFVDDINLQNFKDKEISTYILIKQNHKITEKYGIRDEYELHNLIRKLAENEGIDFGVHIDFLRMPNIGIGKYNRDEQVQSLIFSESPISIDDFSVKYSEIYGVKAINVQPNYLKNFTKFIDNNSFIRVDYKPFNCEEINLMKNKIIKNFYNLDSVIKIFKNSFNNADLSKINSLNMNSLGYKISNNFVYKSCFTSSVNAIKEYFNNPLKIVTLDEEILKINSTLFSNIREELTNDYNWIQIENYKFINIKLLEVNGITKSDLFDFCNKVLIFCNKNIFSLHSLKNTGFNHKLFDLGFDDYFYESILKKNKQINFRRLNKSSIFKETNRNLTFIDLIYEIIDEKLSIDIYDLLDLLENLYGFLVDKNKLISLIKHSSLYYSDIWEKVYIDYQKYLEEII